VFYKALCCGDDLELELKCRAGGMRLGPAFDISLEV
jgi:hypothetical protein